MCRTTYTLFARRTRRGVAYRVWSHTGEAWVRTLARLAPLTRPEIRRLFRHSPWAAGPVGVKAEEIYYAQGSVHWDPAAWPTRFGGWDVDVTTGSDIPAPCPACGCDLNHLDGDICVHLMSIWTIWDGRGTGPGGTRRRRPA